MSATPIHFMAPITIEFATVYVSFMAVGAAFLSVKPWDFSLPAQYRLIFYHFFGLVALNLHAALRQQDVPLKNRFLEVGKTFMIPLAWLLISAALSNKH